MENGRKGMLVKEQFCQYKRDQVFIGNRVEFVVYFKRILFAPIQPHKMVFQQRRRKEARKNYEEIIVFDNRILHGVCADRLCRDSLRRREC